MRRLIDDLIARDFQAIEADGRNGRLTREELRRAVDGYGRTLVAAPNFLTGLEVYPHDQDPRRFAVDVPLWTKEEGRSDLTLSLTIVETDAGATDSIDDLHVL